MNRTLKHTLTQNEEIEKLPRHLASIEEEITKMDNRLKNSKF